MLNFNFVATSRNRTEIAMLFRLNLHKKYYVVLRRSVVTSYSAHLAS